VASRAFEFVINVKTECRSRRSGHEAAPAVFADSAADLFIADESEKWGKVVKFTGIKAD
jgi:hypothetical protein